MTARHIASKIALVMLFLLLIGFVYSCTRPTPSAPANVSSANVRIVSLAPGLTEMICAIGASSTLVGRTDVCNYPPDVIARVPVVAGFGRPFLEPLLNQKPTLVLDMALEDQAVRATLERAGISSRHIPCRRINDVPTVIRTIGDLVGRTDAARFLATHIEDGIRARRKTLERTTESRKPLVLVEIWHDPLMIAGRDSFVSDLVGLAGGRNLGDELPREYATVSSEWVIEHNPDIILCMYHGANAPVRQTVMLRNGWQSIHAVKSGRVYDAFDLDTILRPGPRVLDGIEQLRQVVE